MGFLFQIRNLSKSFYLSGRKSLSVLNKISFNLPSKGMFIIFGKSGCGKSTLLNILEGLDKPSSGSVLYNNKDIGKFSEKELNNYLKNDIGIVFQNFNLIGNLTVYDNLKLACYIKDSEIKSVIDKYLKKYDLQEVKNTVVNRISGGEKQRLAIIRALINKPKVIFADEPTGNLDDANSKIVIEELKEISKERLVILVTHNNKIVEEYTDAYLNLTNGTQFFLKPFEEEAALEINEEKKEKHKKTFVPFMLIKNYFKNFSHNMISCIAIFFVLLVCVSSLGFENGVKNNSINLISNFPNSNNFKISKIMYQMKNDSNLQLEKTIRPTEEEVKTLVKDYENYEIDIDLDYLFSGKVETIVEGNELENIKFVPINSLAISNEVYVNHVFKKKYLEKNEGSCLNKIIYLNLEKEILYKANGENRIIKDDYKDNITFNIGAVYNEFDYLNYPKVYFSYQYFKNHLLKKKAFDISEKIGKDISFYEVIENSQNNEDISNFNLLLYFDTVENAIKFYDENKDNKEFKCANDSIYTIYSFMELSSTMNKGLIFFVLVSIFCSLAIISFLSYSHFVFSRKEIALLTSLGAKREETYSVYIFEQLINCVLALISIFAFFPFLSDFMNSFIYREMHFRNLISIDLKNMILSLLMIFISLALVFISIGIPLLLSKNNNIIQELKEE